MAAPPEDIATAQTASRTILLETSEVAADRPLDQTATAGGRSAGAQATPPESPIRPPQPGDILQWEAEG